MSIVTPAFNSRRFIDQTIASAQAQTHTDWEMIVVDDASTDETARHVRAAAEYDKRIQFLCLPKNGGVAAARNVALERARGSLIAFLDSDDLWDATKLERQVSFIRERRAAFVFGAYRLISAHGERLGEIPVEQSSITYHQMLNGARVGTLTVMLDRTALGSRRFPRFSNASDLALWLELLHSGITAEGMPEQLASYRVVPNSLSRKKVRHARVIWDIYRAQPVSLTQAIYSYTKAASGAVLKHFASGASTVKPT